VWRKEGSTDREDEEGDEEGITDREDEEGEDVVVKIVLDREEGRVDKGSATEAIREATALRELGPHPSIVSLLNVVKVDRHTLLVLEPAETDLHEWIKSAHPAPFSLLHRIATSLCSALSHVHERGFMHRDVKPKNVLIDPARERVLLADFGIARRTEGSSKEGSSEGRMYTMTGTYWYTAPEVLLDSPYDERVDLWSLGMTIAHLYAGVPLVVSEDCSPLAVMEVIAGLVGSRRTRLVLSWSKTLPAPLSFEWDSSFLAQPFVVRSLLSFDPSLRPAAREVPSLLIDPLPSPLTPDTLETE